MQTAENKTIDTIIVSEQGVQDFIIEFENAIRKKALENDGFPTGFRMGFIINSERNWVLRPIEGFYIMPETGENRRKLSIVGKTIAEVTQKFCDYFLEKIGKKMIIVGSFGKERFEAKFYLTEEFRWEVDKATVVHVVEHTQL